MKKIYFYINIIAVLLLASCSDQEVISTPSALKPGEYRFTVTIPELTTATRAMGDTPTDVTNMPMRVLVFDENGFFVAFQEATVNEFTPNDQGGGTGTYTVSLPVSNEKCILHFVLGLNDDDYGKIFTPTDSEVSIFSQLAVSDGKDAYWQRLVIEGGIHADTQLPTVALVRNFAKISVTSVANNFTLEGYTIVNETSDGTVAPYTGNDALPYDEEVLRRSYAVLPNNAVLEENKVQQMLDEVYPDARFMNIDYSGVVFKDNQWRLKKLCHCAKSALLEVLNINSVSCILESDVESYKEGNSNERIKMEIPMSFKSVGFNRLQVVKMGTYPFVVPDKSYTESMGLDLAYYTNRTKNQIITVPVTPSTGATGMKMNAGEIGNYGVELQLTGTPIETKDFSWESILNWPRTL